MLERWTDRQERCARHAGCGRPAAGCASSCAPRRIGGTSARAARCGRCIGRRASASASAVPCCCSWPIPGWPRLSSITVPSATSRSIALCARWWRPNCLCSGAVGKRMPWPPACAPYTGASGGPCPRTWARGGRGRPTGRMTRTRSCGSWSPWLTPHYASTRLAWGGWRRGPCARTWRTRPAWARCWASRSRCPPTGPPWSGTWAR